MLVGAVAIPWARTVPIVEAGATGVLFASLALREMMTAAEVPTTKAGQLKLASSSLKPRLWASSAIFARRTAGVGIAKESDVMAEKSTFSNHETTRKR